MTEATETPKGRSEVRGRTALACRLRRKEEIGRRGPVPHMGELELENQSSAPLEIAYTMTPLQHLELVVVGPGGETVSEGHFSDRFSPTLEPLVLRLLPGETFRAQVPLLSTVPREKRTSGVYQVRAVYSHNDCRAVSEPLDVTV